MAKCAVCGKGGILTHVDITGRCSACAKKAVAPHVEIRMGILPQPSPDNPFVSLRSPLAARRRPMFNAPGERDLRKHGLDDVLMAIFLSYNADRDLSDLDKSAYDISTMFPNPSITAAALLKHGYTEMPTVEDVVTRQTIPELKALLSGAGLPIPKGNKPEIVQAVLSGLPKKDLERYAGEHAYIKPSAKGYALMRSLYNERVEAELTIAAALMKRKPKDAIKAANAYAKLRPSLCPVVNVGVAMGSAYTSEGVALMDAAGLLCQTFSVTLQYLQHFQQYPEHRKMPRGIPALPDVVVMPVPVMDD